MSKYTTYYITRQDMFRQLAIQWKDWSDTADLTESQLKGMAIFFRQVGRRFGLINEFRDIGVL